jgi:putative SOS response-associated peptidase YedK
MCGRFTLRHSADQLAARFDVQENALDVEPRYNIAPSQPVVAVTQPDGARHLEAMKWGLVPFWAKDPAIGNRMINAKAETVAEKPAFKHAFQRRRCLIPADGFYEWKKLPDGKQPMLIHRKADDLFAFAGLWEEWNDPGAGPDAPPLRTCTIITVAPNAVVAPIHDRMPAILRPEDETHWLDPSIRDGRALLDLLGPYAQEETMNSYAVSRLVNAPGNDGPECIAPLDEELAAAAA